MESRMNNITHRSSVSAAAADQGTPGTAAPKPEQNDSPPEQTLIQQQEWRKEMKKKIDKQLSRRCNKMLIFGKTVQKMQRDMNYS